MRFSPLILLPFLCALLLWLASACAGGNGTPAPWWPPEQPRQPKRLQLREPGLANRKLWWRENILAAVPGKLLQDAAQTEVALRLLKKTNAVRTERGLAPVSLAPGLCSAALAHAWDQGTRDYWSHKTPEGLCSRERAEAAGLTGLGYCSENSSIALPGAKTPEEVVREWEAHPGHRELLLNPDVNSMGGAAYSYGAGEYVYFVQLLARTE